MESADQKVKDFEDAVLALLRLSTAARLRALGEAELRARIKYFTWRGNEPSRKPPKVRWKGDGD